MVGIVSFPNYFEKATNTPNMKEWTKVMVETASYECTFSRLKGDPVDKFRIKYAL